ncbi:MAG: tetratricopeptide repeat protein [Cyclobacteriaceae bacterium]
MAETRLEQLLKFYKEDPNDAFTLYGLALEYAKTDIKKSEELFDKLLKNLPSYLPTYYQAAKLKETLGSKDAALSIYRAGIELAKKINDRKTHLELQSAFDELMFELHG